MTFVAWRLSCQSASHAGGQWWSDKMGSGGACFFVTDAAQVCKLPEQHDHAAAALVRLSRTAREHVVVASEEHPRQPCRSCTAHNTGATWLHTLVKPDGVCHCCTVKACSARPEGQYPRAAVCYGCEKVITQLDGQSPEAAETVPAPYQLFPDNSNATVR
jgi:hypothetical protein